MARPIKNVVRRRLSKLGSPEGGKWHLMWEGISTGAVCGRSFEGEGTSWRYRAEVSRHTLCTSCLSKEAAGG